MDVKRTKKFLESLSSEDDMIKWIIENPDKIDYIEGDVYELSIYLKGEGDKKDLLGMRVASGYASTILLKQFLGISTKKFNFF